MTDVRCVWCNALVHFHRVKGWRHVRDNRRKDHAVLPRLPQAPHDVEDRRFR